MAKLIIKIDILDCKIIKKSNLAGHFSKNYRSKSLAIIIKLITITLHL